MTHNTQVLDEILKPLTATTVELAHKMFDDTTVLGIELNRLEDAKFFVKQAILKWVNDEVIGKDTKFEEVDESLSDAVHAINDKNKIQRNILKQHGFKESE